MTDPIFTEHENNGGTHRCFPQPPTVLARVVTGSGEIQLQHRRLADQSVVFEIISNGVFLMSSEFTCGEKSLARQALAGIEQQTAADRRVLIGGLGMGFTLQETLAHAVTRVDIVEISHHVVAWNCRYLAQLNGQALSDPRVHVIRDDLFAVLKQTKPGAYAAIILDVDNGPSWLAHERNARLYTDEALAAWAQIVAPGGVFAVWSAQPEPEFMHRMNRFFQDTEEQAVALPDHHGRPRNDYIYTGCRPTGRSCRNPRTF